MSISKQQEKIDDETLVTNSWKFKIKELFDQEDSERKTKSNS